MTAGSSSIMRICQKKNAWSRNFKVIIRGTVDFLCLNRFGTKGYCNIVVIFVVLKFDHWFNVWFWSNAPNMYIFMFSGSIPIRFFFWIQVGINFFFQLSFWKKSWRCRVLNYNSKPSYMCRKNTLVSNLEKMDLNCGFDSALVFR